MTDLTSNPSVVPLHEEACIEAALHYDDASGQRAFAEGYERAMIIAARRANRLAVETQAEPPLSDAGAQRLVDYLDAREGLKRKTAKELVDLAQEHLIDLKPVHDLILSELCSRVHPGWENDEVSAADEYRKCEIGNCCMRAAANSVYCEAHRPAQNGTRESRVETFLRESNERKHTADCKVRGWDAPEGTHPCTCGADTRS